MLLDGNIDYRGRLTDTEGQKTLLEETASEQEYPCTICTTIAITIIQIRLFASITYVLIKGEQKTSHFDIFYFAQF